MMRQAAALLICLLGSLPLAAGEHDWPSFRGHNANGYGSGKTPLDWNTETGKNLLWKTEIPGLAHSSPVIWGDRVFVTTAVREAGEADLKVGLYGDITPVNDDSEHSWKVLALDKSTGSILWEQTAHRGVPAVKRHTKSTHASSTPATDGERIVAFFGSEGLYAYTMSGELLWKRDFGVLDAGFFRVPGAQWEFGSSPVLHDGKVLIQVDVQKGSFIAALDAKTGEDLWRTPRDEVPTWSSPALAPYATGEGTRLQVVANGWKHIGGYDLETGEELWSLVGGGDIPVPTPIVADDLILITSAHGTMRPIYAVKSSARGVVTPASEAMAWWHEKLGNYMQTPIVYEGLGYFCLDNGVLTVVDLENGERVYQERLGGGQSGFTSSPVLVDGKLYFTSEDGDTYVVKPGRELEVLATNELGETFLSTPAVSDGVLFFRGRHHLFAIGEAGEVADLAAEAKP